MMRFLHLTLLCAVLNFSSTRLALEYSPQPADPTMESEGSQKSSEDEEAPLTSPIILQSKDGGTTWQNISQGLPMAEEPEDFFAGDSELYLRLKNRMYHSPSNLSYPSWKRDQTLDPLSTSITFNSSGVKALNYNNGKIFQKQPSGIWKPVYENFKRNLIRTTFETSDGAIFIGCDSGLYKSTDKGKSWKLVLKEGGVMNLVESESVLIGIGQKGIMRSTDKGEHWDWVISEGGVGIYVTHIKGGFAAISYNTTSQTRRIRISLDKGETWRAIDDQFQSTFYIPIHGAPRSSSLISSIKQVGEYLICGHPDGIYQSKNMGKTWNIVYSGVENKVFTIYVSGATLYAILRNGGC